MALEAVTPATIEAWRGSLAGLSNRSKNKLLIVLHGIFRRAQTVYGLPANPLARTEKHPQRSSGDIEVFSPEEAWALVRAASSEQDGALFLTAVHRLRMGELLALHWRDVDFAGSVVRVRASFAAAQLTTPKSGKVRAVPLAAAVASALAALGHRLDWVGDDDLAIDPRLMGLLLYAYPKGQQSSRGIELGCVEDVGYRVWRRIRSLTTRRLPASAAGMRRRGRVCSGVCWGCAPRRVWCEHPDHPALDAQSHSRADSGSAEASPPPVRTDSGPSFTGKPVPDAGRGFAGTETPGGVVPPGVQRPRRRWLSSRAVFDCGLVEGLLCTVDNCEGG